MVAEINKQYLAKIDGFRLAGTVNSVAVVGISRVSARKYLNILKDLGILEVKVIYGTIGRPVYQHEYNKFKERLIKNFL